MGKSGPDQGAEFSPNETYAHIYQEGESLTLSALRSGRAGISESGFRGPLQPLRVPWAHVLCTCVYVTTRLRALAVLVGQMGGELRLNEPEPRRQRHG